MADLCDLLMHPEAILQALGRIQSGQWLPQEVQARRDSLKKASASLSRQVDRLTEAYLEQIVSLEEHRRRRQDLEERQESMKTHLRELEAHLDHQRELAAVAAGIESFCQRVQDGLEHATFEQKRHLVELLIDRVIVTGDEVEIRYVIPTSPLGETSRFYQLRIPYCGALSSQLSSRMPSRAASGDAGAGASRDRAVPAALQLRAPPESGSVVAIVRRARRFPPCRNCHRCPMWSILIAGCRSATACRWCAPSAAMAR